MENIAEDLNNHFIFNSINNNQNANTPRYDKTIVNNDGNLLEIDTETINLIMNDINSDFSLINFSYFKSVKDVLEYYYFREKKHIENIIINFTNNTDQQQFFIKFTIDIIREKYNYNESLNNIKPKIELGLEYLIKKFKEENFGINNLPNKYFEIFKTNKIPQFIEGKIIDEIKSINCIKELNSFNNINSFEEMNFKNLNELMIIYYIQLLNGNAKPFECANKEILFNILLYSNLEDIYKNPKLKKIFLNNYPEISNCFSYVQNRNEFEYIINNNKESNCIKNELIENFNKYELNDSHLFNLASYFYLTMNLMKDPNGNNNKRKRFNNKIINSNNVLLSKILRNVFNNFHLYCPNNQFNLVTYINLINYFNKYIIINSLGEKINKNYKNKMNNLKINNIIKEKLNIQLIQDKLKDSLIKLIPLTKNRNSNKITILISGFLSQNDDINSWKNFFDYDRYNSNYYLFRWPSSDIFSLILNCRLLVLKYRENFLKCKKIAKLAGRILALFLSCNKDFNNCQINLVGFSLGCQVIKFCLKELDRKEGHRDMINNVLFLGGTAIFRDEKKNFWRNVFRNNVGGRVINCYSKCDDVLSCLLKICESKSPNGLNKINIKDEKGEYDIVENYDFSDIKLGHLQYRDKFDIILKRINFLNSS